MSPMEVVFHDERGIPSSLGWASSVDWLTLSFADEMRNNVVCTYLMSKCPCLLLVKAASLFRCIAFVTAAPHKCPGCVVALSSVYLMSFHLFQSQKAKES